MFTRDSQARLPVHPDDGHDAAGAAALPDLPGLLRFQPIHPDDVRPMLSPERHPRGCS